MALTIEQQKEKLRLQIAIKKKEIEIKKKKAARAVEQETEKEEPKEKTSFLQRIGIGGTPEQRSLFGLPKGVEKAVFPRASKRQEENLKDGKVSFKEGAQHIASATADVLSVPGRAIAAAPSLIPGGKSFGESFAQSKATPQKGIGKVGEFTGNLLRDPSTIPAALATGGISTVGKGALGKIALGAKAGAQEGLASAATRQIEKFGEEGKVSPKGFAAEVATSAVTGGVLPAVGVLRAKAGGKINKLVGEVAEWTTGVQEKALRMGGKKAEREVLKKSFDKQFEIGAELVGMIDQANTQMVDYDKVVKALDKSPSVGVIPFMSKLRKLAGDPQTTQMQGVSKKIKAMVDDIQKTAAKRGDTGFMRPNDLNNFRIELDQIIGDRFGKDSDKFINALKIVRHDMQEAVKKTAKGTEYEGVINDYARKLESISDLKKMVGWDGKTRELRAESFIRNINNKGKKKQKEWLKNFEDVFGGEFVKKAELARLAEMMGPTGKGGILPNWTTGRSLYAAKAAGFMVGSPRAASQITLPLTESLTKEVPKTLSFAARQAGRVAKEEKNNNRRKPGTFGRSF